MLCASVVGRYTPEKRESRGGPRVKKMAEEDRERDADDSNDDVITGSDDDMISQNFNLDMTDEKLAEKIEKGEKLDMEFEAGSDRNENEENTKHEL